MSKLHVRMADFRVARGPDVLTSYGIGSCLAIAVFDTRMGIAGLAHGMLPEYCNGPGTDDPKKYVDRLIGMLVEEIVRQGGRATGLGAKIAGGAQMFVALEDSSRRSIGERNIAAAMGVLGDMRIPVEARDVGGGHGRSVFLNSGSAEMMIRSYRMGERKI